MLFGVEDLDGTAWQVSYAPPEPLAHVLAWHPGCHVEPTPEPALDAPMPPDLRSLVNTYLDRIGEHDPVARAEAQALAASRPKIAQRYRERTSREPAADESASPKVYLVSHPDRATGEKNLSLSRRQARAHRNPRLFKAIPSVSMPPWST
jgi:hypothetical protein